MRNEAVKKIGKGGGFEAIYNILAIPIGVSAISLALACIFNVLDFETPATLVLETGTNQINMPSHIEHFAGYAHAEKAMIYISASFIGLFFAGAIISLLSLAVIYSLQKLSALSATEETDVTAPIFNSFGEYLNTIIPIVLLMIAGLALLHFGLGTVLSL